MSNKTYGLNKEREFKKKLIDEGWYPARARGSFGLFDIICMCPHRGWRCIQIKSTKQRYVSYKKDCDQIVNLSVPGNTTKELWVYWSPCKGRKKKGWEQILFIDILVRGRD